MFCDVLLEGFKYTHPPPYPEDGRKMSLFGESAMRRTSHNRASDAILRGDSSECRPSGDENRTRKATDVYDEIVSTLARQGRGTAIREREVEDLLIMKLGATQQTTLNRHKDIMVRLGYLKTAKRSTAFTGAEYDLVGAKVREVKLLEKARELAGREKKVSRRR